MADDSVASVHQGTGLVDLSAEITERRLSAIRFTNNKLTYSLMFAGLVGASFLYVNLGAHANGIDQSNASADSQQNSQTKPSGPANSDSTPLPKDDSGSINVNLNSSQSSTNGQSSSSTSLNVNGQNVPVSGGNVHKTFTSDDGHSRVQINQTNNSSSTGGSD